MEFAFKSKKGRRKIEKFAAKKRKLENLPSGEDLASFESHNKLLQLQSKKVYHSCINYVHLRLIMTEI